METGHRIQFRIGMLDGIPIAAGYFAVAFSLGITARGCGFSALQGFVASITTYASAGEYIGFTLYAANATLLQLVIMTVITNARYVLMGFALNQKLPPETPMRLRSIARQGALDPFYSFGALCVAAPMWAIGTALGIAVGNVLSGQIVSALSVALFGMFLAVIVPACRKDRIVLPVVLVSFAASLGVRYMPVIRSWSSGNRTILLTLVISAGAALLFPVKDA